MKFNSFIKVLFLASIILIVSCHGSTTVEKTVQNNSSESITITATANYIVDSTFTVLPGESFLLYSKWLENVYYNKIILVLQKAIL